MCKMLIMKSKIFLSFLFLFLYFNSFAQLQYKTGKLYLSPYASIGASAILNQNNFGFGEMAYQFKLGKEAGILFGYDNYLKTSYRFGVIYAEIGQKYGDVLLEIPHEKEITLTYIQVPVVYKYVFGKTKNYDYSELFKYILGGIQIGYLIDANVIWKRDGKEVEFYDFISYGPYEHDNKNLEEIRDNGPISSDMDFFSKIDISLVGGGGIQYFVARRIMVFTELTGNVGVRDINAPKWRFRNNKKAYNSSLNLFAGLRLGISYYP